MTESEPRIQETEKRNIFHNALVEVLDFVEKRRETFAKWQKDREKKRIRTNDYCALVDNIWNSGIPIECKQGELDKYNKKYGTDYTLNNY